MNNNELDKVIKTISDDLNKTLKANLVSCFKTIDNNNKIIDNLKTVLFNMPEYIKLKNDYINLQEEYLTLKNNYDDLRSSNVKNIKIDISETKTDFVKNKDANFINSSDEKNYVIKENESQEESQEESLERDAKNKSH